MIRAEGALELLDRPVSATERAASLADIDRLNAWFGGYTLTLREIRRVAARAPARRLIVLDVGGGHAAFAARLVRWARRTGRAIRVVVVERDAQTLALARRICDAYPEIALVRADATALPFARGAAAVVANDLLRTRLALTLVWLATRLLRCHPISRHDGPLSVRRAYSGAELRALAARAGIRRLDVREYPAFGRLVAVTR